MSPALSPNTQAILLLTAPLSIGREAPSERPLSPLEYARLAVHLRERQRSPAELMTPRAAEALQGFAAVEERRLLRLLERGFVLSQAVERWQSRAIWVLSRADAAYPRRLKRRLKQAAPAVLYGCGQGALLQTGGLAILGSPRSDQGSLDYTEAVARLAARAGQTLLVGSSSELERAGLRGVWQGGGKAVGVLADALDKTATSREHRDALLEGRLVLLSPDDPSVGLHAGSAEQRSRLLWALAQAVLVVSGEAEAAPAGTSDGESVPLYVRSTGVSSSALDELRSRGAQPWPSPIDEASLNAVLTGNK